ncbi:MAG: glycoside hydrolase family 5 protein, partial [Chloroflexi bacterium]|nr:glycoside hydrolase family 5 protein [Chloroflexota bacterium]
QNPDWHSDSKTRYALFWEHPHFQDRFVALWEELARRYVGNATVAAYDVVNEPMTAPPHTPNAKYSWDVLNAVQRRVVDAVRKIDRDHIIVLEGDGFGSRFDGLAAPFADNLAYSSHNYTAAGFGPGKYPGEFLGNWRDRAAYHEIFRTQQGTQFAQEHNVPLWVGEFGSVYNGTKEEIPDRLRALDDQIDIFKEFGAHWTTWTYKDVGVMGWVTLDPESEYMRLMQSLLDTKRELDTDSLMSWLPTTRVKDKLCELSDLIAETISDPDVDAKHVHEGLRHAALATYAGALLHPVWAKRFKGMSESDVDRVLQSFALRNCRPHQGLLDVVGKYMSRERA